MNKDSSSSSTSSSLGSFSTSCIPSQDDNELAPPPPVSCVEVPTEIGVPRGEGGQQNDQVNNDDASNEETDNDFVLGIVAERARQARQDLDNRRDNGEDTAPMHLSGEEQDQKMAARRQLGKEKEGEGGDCFDKKDTCTTQESTSGCQDHVNTRLGTSSAGSAAASHPMHLDCKKSSSSLEGTGQDNSDETVKENKGATIVDVDELASNNHEGIAAVRRTESQPGAIYIRNPLSDNNAHPDEESHSMADISVQYDNVSTGHDQEEQPQPQPIRQVSLVAHLVVDCDNVRLPSREMVCDDEAPTVEMTSSERDSANFNSINALPVVLDGPDVRREKDIHESVRGRRRFFRLSIAGIIVMVGVIVILVLGLAGVLRGGDGDDVDDSEPPVALSSPTLASIQQAGVLQCAGSTFARSAIYDFEEALCKVLAAAILGDAEKVEFTDLFLMQQRFSGLANGDVDVLVYIITHTMQRDVFEPVSESAFTFSAPYYYEGMKIAGIPSYVQCVENNFQHLDECSDLKVCVFGGGTYDVALRKLLPSRNIVPLDFVYYTSEIVEKIKGGLCNVIAEAPYSITESIARENGYHGEYAISEQYFSKDPLSMVTRSDDPVFSDFVNSVFQSLLAAEQHGITQENALSFQQTNLFGEEYQDMFRNAIGFAGNFEQIYDALFAEHVPRDALNSLNNGSSGLIYSHPFGDISHSRDDRPLGHRMQGIVDRGLLRCGVVQSNGPGFSTRGGDEELGGMDVEYCCAVAAGLFLGDKDAVEFVEIDTGTSGFALLADGYIDLLSGAAHNLQNDVHEPTTGMGYALSQPYYYGHREDEANLCLATHQDDKDWSSFVYWIVASTFYAEEMNITLVLSNSMPEVFVYGPRFHRMFRDAILAVGNYGELYERNLGDILPRAGRNQLNVNPHLGPQQYPLPGFF